MQQPLPQRTGKARPGRQLRFKTQRTQRLPNVVETVEQVTPAAGHARSIGLPHPHVLFASVRRQDQFEAVGEDQTWRIRRHERIAQSGQFSLQGSSAFTKQVAPRRREGEDGWCVVDQHAVEVVRRPGATKGGCLLVQLDSMAQLGQASRGGHPRQPTADHGDRRAFHAQKGRGGAALSGARLEP